MPLDFMRMSEMSMARTQGEDERRTWGENRLNKKSVSGKSAAEQREERKS